MSDEPRVPADALDITDEHFLQIVTGVCTAFRLAAHGIGEAYDAAKKCSTTPLHREAHAVLCKHAIDIYDVARERYIETGKIAIRYFANNEQHAQRCFADIRESAPPMGAEVWRQVDEEMRRRAKQAPPVATPRADKENNPKLN